MGQNDSFLIHYAEGRGNNLGKAKNKVEGWGQFKTRFHEPTRTAERRKVFDKLSKDEQDNLKAIDGWLIGASVDDGKRRNKTIHSRDLASLDIDYATPALVDAFELGATPISHLEFMVFTTRRSTPEKPRLRLYMPLPRPLDRDEYAAFIRLFAEKLEGKSPMTMVDKVSFRHAQMMFKPTASIDGEYKFIENEGDMVDPDAMFAAFPDWQNITALPKCADEGDLRKSAEKAEDPFTKKGVIGAFCRAYDVEAAIATFLSDRYAPADDYSAKPRYTYLLGTSTSGAVVEDEGRFLYSHHGSDPTADRLVNSFDLCRIHLYGELDEGEDKDTPQTQLPSYKAFVEFIADDPEFRRQQAQDRYDLTAMFEDVVEEADEHDHAYATLNETDGVNGESPEEDLIGLNGHAHDLEDLIGLPTSNRRVRAKPGDVAKRPKAPDTKTWFPDSLELDKDGNVKSTMSNEAIIIFNDPRTHAAVAFNDFSKQIVLRFPIQSKLDIAPALIVRDRVNGDRWQDVMDITIRALLEFPNGAGKRGYGMSVTDRNNAAAIRLAAQRNAFHPIREYVTTRVWDGVERIDTMLIRFLGCPDTPYHREIIRLKMIASVARIMEPGCKFDYAIIIQGAQGIRKSSFIKALYGEDWFGELHCRLDDMQQIAETIAGAWALELPELSGFRKSDHNDAKAFMRRQTDDVRMAFDRRVSEFPRQCVVWGTTNDTKYLKDPTGNRSYWPVLVGVHEIDTDAVSVERDQLWAEAVVAYRAMREAKPHGELPLTLTREAINEANTKQEAARTEELHEMWAERFADWLDKPVTLRELLAELGVAPDDKFSDGASTGDMMVLRIATTREMLVEGALRKDYGITDYQTAQNVERALPLIEGWHQPTDTIRGGARLTVMGKRARWWLRHDVTRDELKQGYRLVETLI